MNMPEVKEIAKQRGVKAGTKKKGELIRAIQQEEGNEACYETGKAASCGQDECLWRGDCK
ncbi:SAP domain-containing protein [Geotalea uraniireducens]|uniref:SAP domain-containing protein n=1 Tax=Geotalea uraniireducens TaxID=351604 RepID=A0ABM8EIC1_9BACT|nr:SAP domain-containing protein [Geotalea uraniireducens]BDV41978.1 SAP domain-containing protein [Geotalea uraniireducens]